MTQTNTPKSVEEVVIEVMQADKAIELFQTMVIKSQNMGNLNMEVNNLKNKLATREKETTILQEELDKERDFQIGYKHNVEIWRKNREEIKQKIKVFIKKLYDENEELKGSIAKLKSQDEELQDLGQKAKIWETTKRKWIEELLLHKQQHEALGSHVKALTKEKKEKENVLTNLELVNLNNASMLEFEELRKKTTQAKRKKLMEEKKGYQRNLQHLQAQMEIAQQQKKSLGPTGVKKRLEDYEQML